MGRGPYIYKVSVDLCGAKVEYEENTIRKAAERINVAPMTLLHILWQDRRTIFKHIKVERVPYPPSKKWKKQQNAVQSN